MRHAMEIRHASFVTPEFIELLRKYNVALVCADTVEWPRLMDVTSDFMYCRLHGSEVLYASGYDDAALDQWTTRVHAWARGTEPDDAERVIKQDSPKAKRPRCLRLFRQRRQSPRTLRRARPDQTHQQTSRQVKSKRRASL